MKYFKTKPNVLAIIIVVLLGLPGSLVQGFEGANCDLAEGGCFVIDDKAIRTAEMAREVGNHALPVAQFVDPEDGSHPQIALVKGSDRAVITIIEYSDLTCKACARASKALEEIIDKYPDEIRLVFKHFPSAIIPDAILAHEAAMAAAEQGKFWEFQEKVSLHKGKLTEQVLVQYAKELELEARRFNKAIEDHRYREIIVHEMMEAKGFGVSSAPTFFINGRKLVGARSVNDFKRIIDEELGLTQTARVPQRPSIVTPPPPIVEIDTTDAPSKGPEDAPIIIVEYSDFQCPFCGKAVPTVQQILREYPDQVRWVFKHYPLPIHPDAPLAHEAAHAAGEQGKFWEMHDMIFANQRAIKRADLVGYAQRLGLNLQVFEAALDIGEHRARVERDRVEGEGLGVSGTPTFFINGEKLVGAQPVSAFRSVIDRHLRQAGLDLRKLNQEIVGNLQPEISPRRREKELSAVGPKDATVTVTVFLDYESRLSARAVSILNEIKENYPEEVQLIARSLPLFFHKEAPLAHESALAAGEQGKFWEMQTLIFTDQGKLDKKTLTAYARRLSIDVDRFNKALDEHHYDGILKKDRVEAGRLNVKAVPTFFINNERVDGLVPFSVFKKLIDEALLETEVLETVLN